ncbi:MAG: TlpA family protein disulfide reductase [Bacteroidetes bacterium]|nr:TlpA family protein disulfide reductase [Bacteroidota bacterium]
MGALSAQDLLPNVQIKDLKGQDIPSVSLIDSNALTVVSFWATWCKPCRQELEAISDDWEDFQKTGARLIAVSIDDSRSTGSVQSIANASGWEFNIYLDDNQNLKRALNISAIPYAIVLDKQGKIIRRIQGYNPGEEVELFSFLNTNKQ